MPKKGTAGNLRKKGSDKSNTPTVWKEDENEKYAEVLKELGDNRLRVFCFDDQKERVARIPGKMRGNRMRIHVGDVVLVSVREFEDKGDVLTKYSANDVRLLKKQGKVSSNVKEDDAVADEDVGFDFDAI